jgi:hypothetical protein
MGRQVNFYANSLDLETFFEVLKERVPDVVIFPERFYHGERLTPSAKLPLSMYSSEIRGLITCAKWIDQLTWSADVNGFNVIDKIKGPVVELLGGKIERTILHQARVWYSLEKGVTQPKDKAVLTFSQFVLRAAQKCFPIDHSLHEKMKLRIGQDAQLKVRSKELSLYALTL